LEPKSFKLCPKRIRPSFKMMYTPTHCQDRKLAYLR
jgi:hypothetical protein